MTKEDDYRAIVDAVDRMVNRGDEADAVLRAVVELLLDRLDHVAWAGISLVEDSGLELGPSHGERASGSMSVVGIEYDGRKVGEIALESDEAGAFDKDDLGALERIATLISQHALVAWDTAGETWKP